MRNNHARKQNQYMSVFRIMYSIMLLWIHNVRMLSFTVDWAGHPCFISHEWLTELPNWAISYRLWSDLELNSKYEIFSIFKYLPEKALFKSKTHASPLKYQVKKYFCMNLKDHDAQLLPEGISMHGVQTKNSPL